MIDIGSPGAVRLLFQVHSLTYYSLVEGEGNGEIVVHITIKGGTKVRHSPIVDCLQRVLCPMLEKIGLPKIEVICGSRGVLHRLRFAL